MAIIMIWTPIYCREISVYHEVAIINISPKVMKYMIR